MGRFLILRGLMAAKSKKPAAKAPKQRTGDRLTNQQRAFCEAYLKCFNATKAAIAAGYSEKSAASQASQLLKNPKVDAYLHARYEQSVMKSNELLFHLAQIARGDYADFADDYGMLDMKKATEAGVTNLLKRVRNKSYTTEDGTSYESEVEGYDRMKALELIGRNLSIWNDKIKIEGGDLRLLEMLLNLGKERGISAGEIFQAMIQQFAEAESEDK